MAITTQLGTHQLAKYGVEAAIRHVQKEYPGVQLECRKIDNLGQFAFRLNGCEERVDFEASPFAIGKAVRALIGRAVNRNYKHRRRFRTSLRSIRIARRAPVLRVRLWGPQR